MLDSISYTHTPGGQMLLIGEGDQVQNQVKYELLGVVAQEAAGVFEVKWKGPFVDLGSQVLLPVKGAKGISLKIQIEKVDALITPVGSWSAVCMGPKQREFDLKNIQANCDQCHQDFQLEFIAFSGDDQSDALSAMSLQGWGANMDKQVCPGCHSGALD